MIDQGRLAKWVLIAVATIALGCASPPDPDALVAKARQHAERKEYQSAIIELRNALQQNPNHPEARYRLGATYLASGQPTFATVELRKAQTLGYDPKQLLPDLAKSLILEGKYQDALEATDPARVPAVQGSPFEAYSVYRLHRANRARRLRPTCASLATTPLLAHGRAGSPA